MKNKYFIGIFILGIVLTIINFALFTTASRQAEAKKADEISLGVLIEAYNAFIESQNEVLLRGESNLTETKSNLESILDSFTLNNESELKTELVSEINELIELNSEELKLEELEIRNKQIKVIFDELEIKLNES